MSQYELNLYLQQFTVSEVLEAVNAGRTKPILDASTFQSWVQRGHLPVSPSGGGRGRERLFPSIDGCQANFLAETVGLGLPLSDASALLGYVRSRAAEMMMFGEGRKGALILHVILGPDGMRQVNLCHVSDAGELNQIEPPAVLSINVDIIIGHVAVELDRIAKRKGIDQDDGGQALLERTIMHWEKRIVDLSTEYARAAAAGKNVTVILAELREAADLVSSQRRKLARMPGDTPNA